MPLPTFVVDALAAHMAAYPPRRDGLIFSGKDGQPVARAWLHRTWRKAITEAGLPADTTWHLLRHSYAGILIDGGESVTVVARRLGHANPSETLRTYSHLWPDSDDRTRQSHHDIVRAMIRRLFPAALRHIEYNSYGSDWLKDWLRNRLVAHPDILQFYLQRVAGAGLRSFLRAEQAFAVLGNQELLSEFLDSLPETDVEDVIARLEVYEGEFPEAAVAPACAVLLNRLERMPEQDRGMFSLGPRMVVARVVLRMLRQIEDEGQREAVVREVLPQLTSLSALASEGELLRLLWWVRKTSDDDEPAFELPVGDGLAIALLRGAVTETKSQPVGSRAVSRAQRLAWDSLVSIVGGDEAVAPFLAVVEAGAGADPELSATVHLAKRYANGWRPPEFG